MSINVVVTKDGTVIPSGSQYNYTRAKLTPSEGQIVLFNKTPLSKQSSQYAYTNENPISMEAQSIETQGFMLLSGSRNCVETKVFLGPRTKDFISLILYDDANNVEAEFSGEEFEELLNTDKTKYVSIIYTQVSEGKSYELDLHTDMTTYDDAVDYANLDYLDNLNYPHYNQVKYSNRIVSADDFISSSMNIRSGIKYTPHFGNFYVRPDFVKAFKGFKILGGKSESLIINGTSSLVVEDNPEITLTTTSTGIYYDYLTWDFYPKIPGIFLTPSSDTKSAILKIDSNILTKKDLFEPTITIEVSAFGNTATKFITLTYSNNVPITEDQYTIYLANPSIDTNPWYNVLDYVDLDLAYRYRSDNYTLTQTGSTFLIDESNDRFKFNGDYDSFTSENLTFTFTPKNSATSYTNTLVVTGFDDNFSLSGNILISKLKVLKWVTCKESKVNILTSDSNSCTLSGTSGLVSIKAITNHGKYLYRSVL